MSRNDEKLILHRGWSDAVIGFQFISSNLRNKYVPADYKFTPVSDEVVDRVLNSIKKDGIDVVHSSEPKTDLNSD